MSTFRTAPFRRWSVRVTLVALGMLATACHFDPFGPSLDLAGGHLTGIGISGDSVVAVGDSIRLHASGSVDGLLGMFSYDPLADAKWSTANASIATVAPRPSLEDSVALARASVRGIATGSTYITVSARGFRATHSIRVVQAAR